MPNIEIEKLKRLPQRRDEVWQGDLMDAPVPLEVEGAEPLQPRMAVWVAVKSQKAFPGPPRPPEEAGFDLAWQALMNFATSSEEGGYRPGRVEVRDAALAEYLENQLAETGIEVAHREELEQLDEFAGFMTEQMARMLEVLEGADPDDLADLMNLPEPPGVMTGEGVTLDRVVRFAEAAEAFYEAAPWKHLTDEDLLHIEAPDPPPGLRYATVLGAGGRAMGIGFYDTPEDCWDIRHQTGDPMAWLAGRESGVWSMNFDPPEVLAPEDFELWEEHDLPVASEEAYPHMECYQVDEMPGRPDAATLAFVEGLLRVLAEASEARIDSGRWTATVDTADGPAEYTLALPDLLDPPDHMQRMDRGFEPDRRSIEQAHAQAQRLMEQHQPQSMEETNELLNRELTGKTFDKLGQPPRDDRERAQDLCYQAFDAIGRRELQLARQALEIDPDCADAYVILAERTVDPQEAADLFERGVAAGERALGPERFEEDAGEFWGQLDTRPYMRARMGLARSLEAAGEPEQAVEHYRDMLRLNPDDNQGVRDLLLPRLMELERDDDAAQLLKKYEEDFSATWAYTRALLAFRRDGDTPAARRELAKARKVNPHVVNHLLSEEEPAYRPSTYSPGSDEEAILCVEELGDAFHDTPGAMQWLEKHGRSRLKPRRTKPKKKSRKRKSR